MTDTHETVLEIVRDTAPEIDIDNVDTSANFLEGLGMDSMDFLDLVTRVYEETGVNIPERDYEEVDTIDNLVAYIDERA